MTLDGVNDRAQKKFAELRAKLKLDTAARLDEDKKLIAKIVKLTEEEFQEFQNMPEVTEIEECKMLEVDSIFGFINSLNLPSKLSLAIGLIISGHKTNNFEDMTKAKEIIKEYVLHKGYGGE